MYKRCALRKEVMTQKADILFAQETHFSSFKEHSLFSKKFPNVFYANYKVAKRGVIIAIKDTVDFQKVDLQTDPNGRYLILVCKLDSCWYTLVNIYVPNSNQITFLQALLSKLKLVIKGNLIIRGDFNMVGGRAMDSTSSARSKYNHIFNAFLYKNYLFDVCQHGSERGYSFFSAPHRS